MYLALGIATVIYVAVALGVFGTLTVDQVIASGGTALAVAAEPVLGRAGYWLMSVTALFATAGATNAGLYPAAGLCEQMATTGQFPPVARARASAAACRRGCCSPRRSRSSSRSASTSAPSRRSAARSRCSCSRSSASATSGSAHETGARPSMLVAAVGSAAHRPRRVRVHDPGRRARDRGRDPRHPRARRRPRPRGRTGATRSLTRSRGAEDGHPDRSDHRWRPKRRSPAAVPARADEVAAPARRRSRPRSVRPRGGAPPAEVRPQRLAAKKKESGRRRSCASTRT